MEKNRGKGFATRHGVDHSNADYTIYTDVDFPYLDENVLSVYQALLNGSRSCPCNQESELLQTDFIEARMDLRNFRSAVKMLFNIPTTDTQAGLKGLSLLGKRPCWIQRLAVTYFDLELVKICAKRKLNITEVEATLKHNIDLPGVSLKILSKEVVNLVRIFFGR